MGSGNANHRGVVCAKDRFGQRECHSPLVRLFCKPLTQPPVGENTTTTTDDPHTGFVDGLECLVHQNIDDGLLDRCGNILDRRKIVRRR